MSNREFTATRTMLANAFATAGAELLAYMGSSSALAAIPETDPPKYVAAGPLDEIAKLLPAFDKPAAATVLTDEVRAAMKRAYSLGQTYWQQADSDYRSENKKADATAGRFIELTDEICSKVAVLAHAGKAEAPAAAGIEGLTRYDPDQEWRGCMEERADGDYIKLADVEHLLAHAGVTAEPAAPVQNERSIQGKTISEWYVAWCETSGNLKEAKACISRYQKLVDELQTSGQPRPSVPDHIIHMIQDYGDARADDDRYAASKFGDAITAIRRLLAAQVPAAEVRAQALEDVAKLIDTKVYNYQDECGIYDHSTGVTEYPGNGAEWICEMQELAEEIRSLAHQSTADKASEVRAEEWISVEDQLPEPGMWLVAVETDDGMQVHSLELNKKRQWMHEGEPTFCHGYYFDPKFWRPLPAAPSTADSANTGALGEKGAE